MGQRVSLFIPCLVDQVYPEMGLATVRLLERLGHEVDYDPRQTCCGQPAFNAGHHEEARAVAGVFLEVFGGSETIVCPSGSCVAMVRNFFPSLFEGLGEHRAAVAVGGRVRELCEFLVAAGGADRLEGRLDGRFGFHNSCHASRELRLHDEPLALLSRVAGCEVVLPEGEPVCCGFGGLFSVKFEAIAAAMARSRVEVFRELGVDALISNDPGCIMHMRQECAEREIDLRVLHVAEFLDEATAGRDASE